MEEGTKCRGCGQAPVQKYWHQLLAKIEKKEFDPTVVLTHRFPIEEFADLYDAFDKKEHGIINLCRQGFPNRRLWARQL